MTTPPERPHRRRRRARRPAAEGAAEAGSPASAQDRPNGPEAGPAEHRRAEPGTGRRGTGGRNSGQDDHHGNHGRDSERGWRELAGSSPSQVGLSGALRARDVARPTPADLAAAERSVVLVRRGWQPPPEG
ncbi:hypothetical protein [Jatrophihabitans sp.]|uniref:hypothetical protein n=1 Tax=Jatrophihabitans sp. TaxID=1932789 RepID=UPI002C1EB1DE|nr:hypothetical protein [Jatrophihabitans sp.]